MNKRQDLLGLSSELWWADGWPQSATQKTIGSGFEALDQELPAGGWPCGALSELLSKQIGIGELRLLIPVMRQLTLQQKTVMLMNPPMLPYGPALASHGVDMNHLILLKASDVFDRLWAIEQCLRSNSLGCILAWLPHTDLRPTVFRRLQLAAQQSKDQVLSFVRCRCTHKPAQQLFVYCYYQDPNNALVCVFLSDEAQCIARS